ncbi:hypothetical protein [Thalassotalea agarivorans]|uniref:Uncharacterized protein n=1 Tax=Thalassotalea agarivorans TaxID=349064 RepID=A0A1I0BLU3_THASX|nr:hypothetical protein [Thalassotalea agarivorans]SET07259.1 hypothetical protein SAMN05660429_00975 [Thalassotalea agarivorans]
MKMANCDNCIYQQSNYTIPESCAEQVTQPQYVNIDIDLNVLQQLIREKRLTISDIHPLDKQSKQLVHQTLLACLLCKSSNTLC